MSPVYRLRGATLDDLEPLFRLASTTHMLNLPADRDALRHRLEISIDSSAGKWGKSDPRRGEYVFVLEDLSAPPGDRVAGTSAIIGQHGSKISPHIAFEVATEESYSPTLDLRMVHRTLRLVHSYEGPTEIGGLLLDPARRKNADPHGIRLGTQLSFVRFLYMAMRPERFQPIVHAEMLPPHVSEGWSPLWEALGAKFTGLSYKDADERWRFDKEFVEKLFPSYPIYVTLLPKAAQDVIGAVDEASKPALRLLESIGFRYSNHVDPFDGGPHYTARKEEVTLIRGSSRRTISAGGVPGPGKPVLLGVEPGGDAGATFRAVATVAQVAATVVHVSPDVLGPLEVADGAEATVVPLQGA